MNFLGHHSCYASYVDRIKSRLDLYHFELDISGDDFVDYGTSGLGTYHRSAHATDNGTFSYFQNDSSSFLEMKDVMEKKGEFTMCAKVCLTDMFTENKQSLLFSQTNPVFLIKASSDTGSVGDNIYFSVLNMSNTPVNYTVNGLLSSDLNNAKTNGVISDLETRLDFTITDNACRSDVLTVSLDGLDVSHSIRII